MIESRRGFGRQASRRGAIVPAAIIILIASAGRSEAQYGFGPYGYGYGFGFGFRNNAYQDTQFLNSWSLQNAASAAANRPQPLTAPRYQSRDEGFDERYDPATREAIIDRIARDPGRKMSTLIPAGIRTSASPPRSPSPATSPGPRHVVLLANFFDQNRRLIWPAVAPITGDLGRKREVSDLAVLGVLDEYEAKGLARPSIVAEARQKLLDYGRPALDFVRKQTTPAISDSFHAFLLSLYTDVGLAATVRKGQ